MCDILLKSMVSLQVFGMLIAMTCMAVDTFSGVKVSDNIVRFCVGCGFFGAGMFLVEIVGHALYHMWMQP